MKTTEQQILKFMKAMGLDYNISLTKLFYEKGHEVFCVLIEVYNKKTKEVEYKQHHCYQLTRDNKLKYSEGNQEKGISDGILAYIGDNKGVDNYFDIKGRELVMNHIRK